MTNTVDVKSNSPYTSEHVAGGTITPGHLIILNSSNAVVVHATAGGAAAADFAIENYLVGKKISDTYASGDLVLHKMFGPGDIVNAFVAANAAAIVIGDLLESAANGALRKVVAQADTDGTGAPEIRTHKIIGRALQAVDNSANASQARILVEIV